jgi:hypothetical protein
VSFSVEQRLALLKIVSRIEEGAGAVPRAGGQVGRFLRELGLLRVRVAELVPHDGQFVRGRTLGAINLTPLAALRERVESELFGEVASTIAICEELAGLVNVTLWGKARPANRLRNVWLRGTTTVRVAGDFRWFAPRRMTPGTASVDEIAESPSCWDARCLKFMADEFLAAPAAVSYRWDSAFGPPDFRTFRVAALHETPGDWAIVPSSGARLSQPVLASCVNATTFGAARVSGLALAMLCRDPWEARWSLADFEPVDANTVLAHMITWADHRRELLGLPSPTAQEVAAFQSILSSIGYATARPDSLERANLRRSVAPNARRLGAWTRGIV